MPPEKEGEQEKKNSFYVGRLAHLLLNLPQLPPASEQHSWFYFPCQHTAHTWPAKPLLQVHTQKRSLQEIDGAQWKGVKKERNHMCETL